MVRLREGGIINAGTGILAAELGNDVVGVVLHTEALSLQHFHISSDLTHLRVGGFFEGHGFALRAVVAHVMISAGSCTSRLM